MKIYLQCTSIDSDKYILWSVRPICRIKYLTFSRQMVVERRPMNPFRIFSDFLIFRVGLWLRGSAAVPGDWKGSVLFLFYFSGGVTCGTSYLLLLYFWPVSGSDGPVREMFAFLSSGAQDGRTAPLSPQVTFCKGSLSVVVRPATCIMCCL